MYWENDEKSEEIFLTGSVTFWMIEKFIFDRKDVPNFMLNYFLRLFFSFHEETEVVKHYFHVIV